MFRRILLVTALFCLPFAATADDQAPGRYQLQPVEGGVVRVDTATGEMTLCKAAGGALDCAPAAPTGAAPGLAALQARVDALERQVAAQNKAGNLPSDEEVDRGLSIMEKFMRRFMGLAHEMDRENQHSDALPQKT